MALLKISLALSTYSGARISAKGYPISSSWKYPRAFSRAGFM